MSTVFLATVDIGCKAVAVTDTAADATRLACSTAMEHLQAAHGDLGYDDPMMVGKYFGVTVTEFDVGTAILQHQRCALAS